METKVLKPYLAQGRGPFTSFCHKTSFRDTGTEYQGDWINSYSGACGMSGFPSYIDKSAATSPPQFDRCANGTEIVRLDHW